MLLYLLALVPLDQDLLLKSIHNQISEVLTHKTHTQIPLSLVTFITTGLMIGKSILTSKLVNTLNQTLEDQTQRMLTLISLSVLIYTMTGLTIGLITNNSIETLEVKKSGTLKKDSHEKNKPLLFTYLRLK